MATATARPGSGGGAATTALETVGTLRIADYSALRLLSSTGVFCLGHGSPPSAPAERHELSRWTARTARVWWAFVPFEVLARATQAARGAAALLVVMTAGCGPRIEQERPVPEYRIEACETWCAMMFDPVCPAQEVEVETEAKCIEGCSRNDVIWGYEGEDEDVCAETYIPYVDCLEMLSCAELQTHFALRNVVPDEQRSSCGEYLRAQLDCQLPYQ